MTAEQSPLHNPVLSRGAGDAGAVCAQRGIDPIGVAQRQASK